MTRRDAFFRFLTPGNLYTTALVFICITAVIVAMIYAYLYVKKKRFRAKARITEQLNTWVSEALTEDELPEIVMPPEIAAQFEREDIRQFVTDSLINIRKNVAGSAADSVVKVYEALGLNKDSLKKMKSRAWHRKAKGIWELYMMQQREALQDIQQYTDSENEYVRTEAQTAIVGFTGFDGLSFLDTLTNPINEWQQLKILEQLDTYNAEEMPNLPLWLRSQNEYVVHFALKLTDIYQQFHVHDNVVACLAGGNAKVRSQAIKALGRIANADTVAVLKGRYAEETDANKLEILKQVLVNGTAEDLPFLEAALDEQDDSLKKEAGKAIVNIEPQAISLLEVRAAGNANMASIVSHIKYELAI